jgi:hypothetical protein
MMIRDKLAAFCSFGLFAGWASLTMAASPQQERTASWYAEHPSILESVTKLCRDDPGHAIHNPDCMNASQAQALVALQESERRSSGELTPPSDPRYWKIHPDELSSRLAICDRAFADERAALWCPAAYAAAGRSK